MAEKMFQWRTQSTNMIPRDDHILHLAKVVQRGESLPPILVFPVAGAYYVIDGHHRLAAYDTAGWKRDIPAVVFEGNLREAEREALRRNSKHGLPMTLEDRTGAAWRLTTESKPDEWEDSISDVQRLCGVGKGTVNRMRDAWKTLHKQEGANPEELKRISWAQARARAQGLPEEKPYDDWIEAKVDKLVVAIERAKLGPQLTKSADITALALARLDADLPSAMCAWWRREDFDPHDDSEEDMDF